MHSLLWFPYYKDNIVTYVVDHNINVDFFFKYVQLEITNE